MYSQPVKVLKLTEQPRMVRSEGSLALGQFFERSTLFFSNSLAPQFVFFYSAAVLNVYTNYGTSTTIALNIYPKLFKLWSCLLGK